jgi:UDP-glucose:(glucosyl)LPS alpha-1,2-glucosyltransferase
MSCIYKGEVIESEQSTNAMGGTEMMRKRLIDNCNPEHLKNVAIHFSRPREMYDDVKNILYCHDLAEDPEMRNTLSLYNNGHQNWDHLVFVTAWQRDQYVYQYKIPYSKTSVIHNAIEKEYDFPSDDKDYSTIRFIYHTTPHRGLELLVPVFDALTKVFDNIHLDVYSSFGIYGWEQRDKPYEGLFKVIEEHPNMSYHGAVPNSEVLEALEKSHIFLYPNIWKETSCLALIEAIRSGVMCIHPNFGGLPETAANATVMYDYTEDNTMHANMAYSLARQVLQNQQADPNFLKGYTTSDRFAIGRNSIPTFTGNWNKLLKDMSND